VPPRLFAQCLADAGLPAAPSPQFSHAVARDRQTFAVFHDLHRAVESGEPPLRLQTLFLAGVSQVVGRHCAVPPARELPRPSVRRIGLVREYLDAYFAENVSLHDLGRLAGLSVFHLVRSFRDQVGLPPCQYQLHRRVRHALSRLRAGAPIAAAACEAGFVDQSHLTRHFKRIVGITPGQFCAHRKNVQDRRV
jgi:AraC-like DNA-binding protein